MELIYLPSELHNIIASYIDDHGDLTYYSEIFPCLNYITLITYRYPIHILTSFDNDPKEEYYQLLSYERYGSLYEWSYR